MLAHPSYLTKAGLGIVESTVQKPEATLALGSYT